MTADQETPSVYFQTKDWSTLQNAVRSSVVNNNNNNYRAKAEISLRRGFRGRTGDR
jgi:hypothetical protein